MRKVKVTRVAARRMKVRAVLVTMILVALAGLSSWTQSNIFQITHFSNLCLAFVIITFLEFHQLNITMTFHWNIYLHSNNFRYFIFHQKIFYLPFCVLSFSVWHYQISVTSLLTGTVVLLVWSRPRSPPPECCLLPPCLPPQDRLTYFFLRSSRNLSSTSCFSLKLF